MQWGYIFIHIWAKNLMLRAVLFPFGLYALVSFYCRQLGETEVQLLLTNSVDKSIVFYLKVFLLTNSSSWICRSSARRSRKSCIEATLVTTSSEPFVSAHMLSLVDNYDLNDYQR